jgi:hypothetical protein
MTEEEKSERASKDAAIVKKVMERFESLAAQRHGLEKVWEEDDRQYNNLIDERYYHGTADVKVPATYDAIETLVSFGMDAIFSKEMPVQKVAPEGGDVDKVKLYNRAALIKMDNMPNRKPFRDRMEDSLRGGCVYGNAVIKAPFDSTLKGANYIPLPNEEMYYDFFVDEPYKLDFVTQKIRRTCSSLLKNKNKYNRGYNITKDKLKQLAKASTEDKVTGKIYRHIVQEYNISDTKAASDVDYCDLYETHLLWEWEGELKWTICTIVNKKLLIRFEQADYDFPPYLFWIINKQKGTLLGKSICRLIRPHQIELNDYRSQTLDAGTMALQPMYSVDQLADIEPSQLRSRPAGVVYSMQPSGVTPIQKDLSFLSVGQAMQATLRQDIQILSGATPSLADVLARDTTAYESRRAYTSSARRVLTLLVRKFVVSVLHAWLDMDFQYTKERVSYEDFMRMVGKEAAREGEESLKEYFDIPMDTIALGFNEVTDKVVKIQQELNNLNIALKAPQVINVAKVAMDTFEAQGKKNVEDYVFLPPKPSLANARDENELLLQGQPIDPPHPRDVHQSHKETHEAIRGELSEHQQLRLDEHLAIHDQMAGQQVGQAPMPPQEQPRATGVPSVQPHGVEESELAGRAGRIPETF